MPRRPAAASLVAMRWERLFADLEGQWEADARRDLEAEVADRTRRERASVDLLTRLAGHRGQSIRLVLVTGGVVEGELSDLGADWILLEQSTRGEVLVPLAAVVGLTGLGLRAEDSTMARRFGLGYALRVLSRDRAAVVLTDLSGQQCTGTIDTVGADALDLAEHRLGEPRRAGNIKGRRTVPFAAIVSVAAR